MTDLGGEPELTSKSQIAIKKLSYQRGILGGVSVYGLVRCQSRSVTFVLPTADGDPPPPLIPTQRHSSLLPPHSMEEQRGTAPEPCKAVTEGREVGQKAPGELRPGKTASPAPELQPQL